MVTARSCIAWSSADWVLGGVRLISSARRTLVNTGPRVSTNAAALEVEDVRAYDVARHEVRGELDSLEGQGQARRERLREQGLGRARDPFEQDVALGEESHEHEVDDVDPVRPRPDAPRCATPL